MGTSKKRKEFSTSGSAQIQIDRPRMDVNLNGLTLAYIGDAYYELCVRQHLLDKKLTHVNELHRQAIRFTASTAQAKIILHWLNGEHMTESEIDLFKKGRNYSGPGRKNVDAKTYHLATGFESLIGSLYLNHRERADQLIQMAIDFIEEGI
ncbi:MAG: ribonuclease III [Acholeplasmataceae bacterium]|nr:ribonuclease III [Acholeplasmataceae bacterium]